MHRRPHRRAGFSLTEVLVALFLVSIGLIALLTLFPLGAIQMGYALRDDRSQLTALQADAKVRDLWRTRVTDPQTPYADDFYTALTNGSGGFAAVPTTELRPSYPVLFDPIGRVSYGSGTKFQSAAGIGATGVARRTTTIPALTFQQSMNYASLLDDLDYATNGAPANNEGVPPTPGNPNLVRQGRFNWAAVIHRPDNSNPKVAELKILVFDRRAPGVNPTGVNDNERSVTGTSASQAVGSNLALAGDTLVTLNGTSEFLGLRVGSWIMDGTTTADIRNANFYRVTAVNDTSDPTKTTVELHVPIARPRGEANPTLAYPGRWYIFRELIDVYDRPPLAPNGYQPSQP